MGQGNAAGASKGENSAAASTPQPPPKAKPLPKRQLTDEMKQGKSPLRTFGDLKQFFDFRHESPKDDAPTPMAAPSADSSAADEARLSDAPEKNASSSQGEAAPSLSSPISPSTADGTGEAERQQPVVHPAAESTSALNEPHRESESSLNAAADG